MVFVSAAIRTGRYTHQKKANDIIEVKTLEGNRKMMMSPEKVNELVNAIYDGVKATDMINILSTHYEKLTSVDPDGLSQVVSASDDLQPLHSIH